jgi:HK97 family phage prohead protease
MPQHEIQIERICEIRTEQISERVVTARIVPYGVTSYEVPSPKGERFLPGSLSKSLGDWARAARPLKLFRSHDYREAVGLASGYEPDAAGGPVVEFRIPQTPGGDEALSQIELGLLDCMSVGFRAVRERRGQDGAREIQEAALIEASLTPIGAYAGADVLAVREPQRALHLPDLTVPPMPSIDLSAPIWR